MATANTSERGGRGSGAVADPMCCSLIEPHGNAMTVLRAPFAIIYKSPACLVVAEWPKPAIWALAPYYQNTKQTMPTN